MARKKKETEDEVKLDELIGKFVDPTNELAVKIDGKTVTINITQVSRANIDNLKYVLDSAGAELILVNHRP